MLRPTYTTHTHIHASIEMIHMICVYRISITLVVAVVAVAVIAMWYEIHYQFCT